MASSDLLMTLIDIFVVWICAYACWKYFNFRKLETDRPTQVGPFLVASGLAVIGFFYLTDLVIVQIIPLFLTPQGPGNVAESLHTHYIWLVVSFGVGSIVAGGIANIAGVSALTEESRQRQMRFRDVAEIASDWIWETDSELRFTYLSNRFFERIPLKPEEIFGKSRLEIAGADLASATWHQHVDDLDSRRPFHDFEYDFALSDGAVRHVSVSGKPIFDQSGSFSGYRGTGTDKTAEIQARRALEESERQFRNLIEGSIQGMYIHRDWHLLFANSTVADIFGYDGPDELIKLQNVKALLDADEWTRLWGYMRARQNGDYAPESFEARCVRKDGSRIWVEFRVKQVEWRGVAAMQCVVIDITDRKRVEEALKAQNEKFRKQDLELKEQNQRFNAALDNMSEGLCMFDRDQRLIVCNKRYASIYNLSPEDVRPGRTLREIIAERIANGIYADTHLDAYLKEREEWVAHATEAYKIKELSDGRVIGITHQPMADGGWIATHADITEFRNIQEQLFHLAHHDALTGLANRALLRERLDGELKRARRGKGFSLLCIDLDGFKGVNDTLGHPAGDELLKAVAERLAGCVRDVDTVARLGGDEFAVIQTSTGQPEEADVLAGRIGEVIAEPFMLGGNEVVIGTSIGVAVAPKDGSDPDALMKKADMALYRAKRDGRGRYRFFEPEMEQSVERHHALGLDLRKALAHGELILHYQPLVNLETNRVSGFEALLRWRHGERGMVAPEEFIPIAEEVGLINQIGEWVLREACREAAGWPGQTRVAVNISPIQLRSGQLVAAVSHALSHSGLAAGRLELEITELALLRDEGTTLSVLEQLQGLGVRISLDDFGTGYSALGYLRSFPFDKVKIDASFIGELTREDGIGIVRSIVALASGLGMATTAEGVETEEQLAILVEEGCTEAQGYLFSPPCPPGDIARLIPLDIGARKGAA